MKKSLLIVGLGMLLVFGGLKTSAQEVIQCIPDLEGFFHSGVTKSGPMIKLNRLGSNPQFGKIPSYTSQSAYNHLKLAAKKSSSDAAELNRILRTLGYTGVNDPSFTEASITPEIIPAGATGYLGAGNHKYQMASMGKDFQGFRIMAYNAPCYVNVMRNCGNIFYRSLRDNADFMSKYGYKEEDKKVECETAINQTITVNGTGKIGGGDHFTGASNVQLIAQYNGQSVCVGSVSVPTNVQYEYAVDGTTSAKEVVKVDNTDGNALSSENLSIPVNLSFGVKETVSSLGSNGNMIMNVTAKRFKRLKKLYGLCPSTATTATPATSLSDPTSDMASATTNTTGTGNGVTGLKRQTLYFDGAASNGMVASKEHNSTVTVVAHAKKSGKLTTGESADKYLCLGQHSVPGSSAIAFTSAGESHLTKALEICDATGNEPSDKAIALPIDLKSMITKQDMKVGNDGVVTIEITEKQYKKLGKRFSRCCSNGDTSCF